MSKCSLCKEPAIWKREFKKDKDKVEDYLCDKCLMDKDKPSEYIDAYKFCG